MLMARKFRVFLALFTILLFACTSTSTLPSIDSSTRTPRPSATKNAADKNTPIPAASQLDVEKEGLRGVQIKAWHPWFGAQAGLFESQAALFNSENEWGIIVNPEARSNFSELFLQTDAALDESNPPQIVIAFPEHAIEWQEHVVDLNTYVHDPLYGL